jgi:hypothetical protein
MIAHKRRAHVGEIKPHSPRSYCNAGNQLISLPIENSSLTDGEPASQVTSGYEVPVLCRNVLLHAADEWLVHLPSQVVSDNMLPLSNGGLKRGRNGQLGTHVPFLYLSTLKRYCFVRPQLKFLSKCTKLC